MSSCDNALEKAGVNPTAYNEECTLKVIQEEMKEYSSAK